jgi:hypothetical protein
MLPEMNLLSILEGLFPVRFTFSDEPSVAGAGEIIIEDPARMAQRSGNPSIPSLKVPLGEATPRDGKLIDIGVNFADDPNVPFPFRGRSLRSKVRTEPTILALGQNEKVLASTERGPVWAGSEKNGRTHFRSGFAFPRISLEGCLIEVLNGDCFLEMLPLLHWLRETCSTTAYHGPPLRACFVFDDPNLHWPRYGFIDFGQIAIRAAKLNYHVAFATIPLDGWFTHKATAEIFRGSKNRLSLTVHGNNHTKKELVWNYTPSARESLLRQAIRRSERIEREAGFPVCRVMIPPHGACSEEMLATLPRCGFEAACISHGSLQAHNQTRPWTRSIGYLPSELIRGCSVLPRWALSGNVINTILLAAFLRQPIILRGHHQDLKDGIELLDHLAGFINGLGSISWSNMTDLSRMNYRWRLEGDTLRVKLLGRKANVQLQADARRLILESPFGCALDRWQISSAASPPLEAPAGEPVSLSVVSDQAVLLETTTPLPVPPKNDSNRIPFRAFIRRCLTEGRDRFLDGLGR